MGRRTAAQLPPAGNTYAGLDGLRGSTFLCWSAATKTGVVSIVRPKLFAEAEKRAEAFWQRSRWQPPKPDYTRDGAAIAELYADTGETVIDLKHDNLARCRCRIPARGRGEFKAAAKRRDAAKAELMDKLGHNAVALLEGFTVKASLMKAIPDKNHCRHGGPDHHRAEILPPICSQRE